MRSLASFTTAFFVFLLMAGWLFRARETVEGEMPSSLASSVMVVRDFFNSDYQFRVRSEKYFVQLWASPCNFVIQLRSCNTEHHKEAQSLLKDAINFHLRQIDFLE